MRAGRLDTPAELLELQQDLTVRCLDWLWFSINSKESADVPAHTGLRSPAKVAVRGWWDERLRAGRYLRSDARLFLIDDVRDFTGQRAEVAITCSELIGQAATYTATPGATALPCRVFLAYGVSRPGQLTGAVEYVTELEAAVVEVGRPQPGAVFEVDGVAWRVAGLVETEDDRVVRRMWVKKV